MALSAEALAETRDAFDSVAADYDRTNRGNPILSAMRKQAMGELVRHLERGAHVLDIGCGPGTDLEALVAAGYHVTAIDPSPAMVAQATALARDRQWSQVRVCELAAQDLAALPSGSFDAVWSDFGALNCVPDMGHVARLIVERLRPGGLVVASVIGRLCPWELALFASRGDWRRASVRFRRGLVAVPLNQHTVWTQYYSPSEFEAAFCVAGATRVGLRGLGIAAPPPYMEGVASRHPALCRRLQALDAVWGAWPVVRRLGDHFVMSLRRS